MACTKCKEKQKIKKEIEKTVDSSEKGIIVFMIIWTLLAIYGIYSLIVNYV